MPALVFAARSLLTRTAALRSSVKPAAAATATAQLWRCMSSASASLADAPSCGPAIPETEKARLKHIRNIGISAHIDSGKTTLTERILFYTGRIREIHEVRGRDGVGAKMDSMELEREKGITIQSAATHTRWGDTHVNIIDTPGHVDFTIEVERALRVLDGAILVLCGSSGVQSQTSTVDRQMRRYKVPRICFINKLDRIGANPWRVIDQVRAKLHLNAAAIQMPMGVESAFEGIIDLITMKAHYFEGPSGEQRKIVDIPAKYLDEAKEKNAELTEKLADVDDAFAEIVLNEQTPTEADYKAAIRRATIALKFAPVMMGSAIKNKGIQTLLDGITSFLPNPTQVENIALDLRENEKPVVLSPDSNEPFIGLAFKLEEGRYGQLTYIRVYQGQITRGDMIFNTKNGKKVKVPRLVRMHSNEMEDVNELKSGEIGAMFGVECASGDTFTDGKLEFSMTSMFVPDPVISLAIQPKNKDNNATFIKAITRFQREDPTFRVHVDQESNETIVSGMGELHLEIYAERMKREYNCECVTGKPRVNFRETILQRAEFSYTHKKQSGGAGQFARVMGYLEPNEGTTACEFSNEVVGQSIPPNFIPACEKGFNESVIKGPLTDNLVTGVRMVLQDGLAHSVDSNELSFRTATKYGFRQAFMNAQPVLLEPIMEVEVTVPTEYQGTVIGEVNRRKGLILNTEATEDICQITCEVPLNAMFGYSTDLRSATAGKGEFSMQYKRHSPVSTAQQVEIIEQFQKKRALERDA